MLSELARLVCLACLEASMVLATVHDLLPRNYILVENYPKKSYRLEVSSKLRRILNFEANDLVTRR